MNQLILYSLIGGLFSLAGGLLLLVNAKLTHQLMIPLISFGAGAFLSAAFLDMLPHAVEEVAEPHSVFVALLTGFVFFFILERLIMKFSRSEGKRHEHSDHTESLPLLIVLGDGFHNFLDGIVIAIAFVANPVLGLPTALAIAAHELPQEVGDFAVLLDLKWNKKKVIAVNVFQSLLTIPGVFLGLFIGEALEPYIPLLLGGAAGIFIYIAASDLIPELHHRAGHKHIFRVVAPLVIAMILLYFVSNSAHAE